jgi:hypothetical protein
MDGSFFGLYFEIFFFIRHNLNSSEVKLGVCVKDAPNDELCGAVILRPHQWMVGA